MKVKLANSYHEVMQLYPKEQLLSLIKEISSEDVEKALTADTLNPMQFLALLSPAAQPYLEQLAQKAHHLTVQHFGKTISLYAPIYIADFCSNDCAYCGFSIHNHQHRSKLTIPEIMEQGAFLVEHGIRHVLILTGEAPSLTPLPWIAEAIEQLRTIFASVSLEIFALDVEEYQLMRQAGADGLTLYQETYDAGRYAELHHKGPKKDYLKRLNTPENACKAGFRSVGIGALYGLSEQVPEAFYSGLHAYYLQQKYLNTEISLSLPRLNEAEGGFQATYPLDDLRFVQFLCAFRLFLPRAGITISTRESAAFRDQLMPLGVTRYSAGSSTAVGGYNHKSDTVPQFSVTDDRSIEDVVDAIRRAGFQPIFKDWMDLT